MAKKRPRGGETQAQQQPEAGRPKGAVPEEQKEAEPKGECFVVINPDGLCWDGAKWVKG
jgi:hypothetical protein